MERKAVVAGKFYPSEEAGLRAFFAREMPRDAAPQDAVAVVMPHAGYVYSGRVSAQTIAAVTVPPVVIVLGPNHTGQGQPFSVMASGTWQTPLGNVHINNVLAEALLRESGLISADVSAHVYEHAIEVQIPFLQYQQSALTFVPLVISGFQLHHFQEVGEAIARVIQASGESVLIVASSDLSHYEPQEQARRKDVQVIESILALDPARMVETVHRERVSMCGFAPVAVMLFAARCLGAASASLISYQNSGDVSGDYERVVGYAGMVIR